MPDSRRVEAWRLAANRHTAAIRALQDSHGHVRDALQILQDALRDHDAAIGGALAGTLAAHDAVLDLIAEWDRE